MRKQWDRKNVSEVPCTYDNLEDFDLYRSSEFILKGFSSKADLRETNKTFGNISMSLSNVTQTS